MKAQILHVNWSAAAALAVLGGVLAGCAAEAPGSGGKAAGSAGATTATLRVESLRKMDPVRIQADTMAFADRFVTAMAEAYDELERGAPTAEARDAAHRLKTDMALAAVGNAVNPRPIAGMMDMVAMTTLLRRIAEDPWTARTFGPETRPLTDRLGQLNADVRTLAAKYLTDRQLAEIIDVVDEWRGAHPEERYVSHLHLADLPAANLPPELVERDPGSVFGLMFVDLTAELDPAVREVELLRATSERMFYYFQRLPFLIQWQTEGSLRRALATPQFGRAADNVAAVAASTTRFAEVGERFAEVGGRLAETAAGLGAQVSAEREAGLRQLFADLRREREAAVGQVAEAAGAHSAAVLADAGGRLAAEREAAVSQFAAAFRREQRNFVNDSEAATTRSLNRLTWRLAGLILLMLGLYVAISLMLSRIRARPAVVGSTAGVAASNGRAGVVGRPRAGERGATAPPARSGPGVTELHEEGDDRVEDDPLGRQ